MAPTKHHYRTREYYQVCQGHVATECPGCRSAEGWCGGHGAVSYCDNTCATALEQWRQALYNGQVPELNRPVPTMASITLGFSNTETGGEFTARFEGPAAEAKALEFMATRKRTHVVYELADQPFDGSVFTQVAAAVYPLCHHEMDASLCMDPVGPHHFGTREWEMAQGW